MCVVNIFMHVNGHTVSDYWVKLVPDPFQYVDCANIEQRELNMPLKSSIERFMIPVKKLKFC